MGDKDITTSKPGPASKIELAGKQVMDHILELARTTELGFSGMAKRINEIYGDLDITDINISSFLKQSNKMVSEYINKKSDLASLRLKLSLDHREKLVMCANKLEKQLEILTGDKGEMMEVNVRANAVANIVDKMRRLLESKARLSGELIDRGRGTNIGKIDNMQINIINEEKSEIMRRLKSFDPEKVVDADVKVIPDENKVPNN